MCCKRRAQDKRSARAQRRPPSKGIKISRDEQNVEIDVFIIVDYEVKIPAVAWEVQVNVKNEVEQMTGLSVTAVNIHVQGVHLPDEEGI